MLPKLDGLEVCKRLRAQSSVPIIMLTARDDELDKVRRPRARRRRLHHEAVLDPRVPEPGAGAAPAGARCRATTARGRRADRASTGCAIDLARADGRARRAAASQLTYVEFELLRTLAAQPGRVYTRQALLESLWGGSDYREPRTIDVHVRHLREKLERDPREPEFILTVRGVGYRFRDR